MPSDNLRQRFEALETEVLPLTGPPATEAIRRRGRRRQRTIRVAVLLSVVLLGAVAVRGAAMWATQPELVPVSPPPTTAQAVVTTTTTAPTTTTTLKPTGDHDKVVDITSSATMMLRIWSVSSATRLIASSPTMRPPQHQSISSSLVTMEPLARASATKTCMTRGSSVSHRPPRSTWRVDGRTRTSPTENGNS